MAYNGQHNANSKSNLRSLDLTIVRPLLGESLDEVSAVLGEKVGRSDLQTFLAQPHLDAAQALDTLRSMLSLPVINAQVNQEDRYSRKPLAYATLAFPEAVELLLRAGASLKSGAYLMHQDAPDQWKAVSALIRAGYPTNEGGLSGAGRTPLHYIAANPQRS